MASLRDLRLPRPFFSLGFFFSSNERISNASATNREHAFDDKHLGVKHN
jgi:hypothetical protein